MFKILLISVIAVTLAQDTRYDGERRRLKVNDGTLPQEARGRPDERPVIHENVGGFQNGNFAYTDGILKTNLNSSQTVKERQNFRPREDTYLHEGAAFRSPGNVQFDVHSSRGRGEVSQEVAEPDEYGANSNEQENQRNQNTNDRSDGQRNQNVNYNVESNRGGGSINEFNTHNTQTNRQADQSTNIDYSEQSDRNSEYANREISNNQNRQSGRGQNTQQTNNQRSESRRGSSETNERSVTTNTNSNNYDRDAIYREMSNQVANMYFKESTEPVSKTTTSNEVRNGTKGQGDRWIWGGGGEQTTTPGVDNRASFVGDQCPTGQVKFNKVCVDVD